MMTKTIPASRSSRALNALLDTDTPEAKAIKDRFHRTMLWKFRAARRHPNLSTAVELERLSGGKVPADGWPRAKSGRAA